VGGISIIDPAGAPAAASTSGSGGGKSEGEEANPRSSPRKLSTPRTRFHSYASLGGERREMSPQGIKTKQAQK